MKKIIATVALVVVALSSLGASEYTTPKFKIGVNVSMFHNFGTVISIDRSFIIPIYNVRIMCVDKNKTPSVTFYEARFFEDELSPYVSK